MKIVSKSETKATLVYNALLWFRNKEGLLKNPPLSGSGGYKMYFCIGNHI